MDLLFDKIYNHEYITKEEVIQLLSIDTLSLDFYRLIYLANDYARKQFRNEGMVFAQVGIDARKCSGNCKFCVLAKDTYKIEVDEQKSLEDLLNVIREFVQLGAKDIFLMATADYPFSKYLELAKQVKQILPKTIRMIGNIGDFQLEEACALVKAGFVGMYHICRLREGVDTDISLETRIRTLEAIKTAGLELYYCVEPIGPEHTYEEIAEEILRATRYPVTVMAAMRRVPVEGTPLAGAGEISSLELAKIVAVSLLIVRPTRAMGVHEPVEMCLIAGANQIYAEVGTNPRDLCQETEKGRGFSVEMAQAMLKNTRWDI